MGFLYENFYAFYYIPIILQGVCVFHVIKTKKPYHWIWVIIFLPFVGSIIYLFAEVISLRSFSFSSLSTLFPGKRIKDQKKKIRKNGSFENKLVLAALFMENNQANEAIEIFESILKGNFENDPKGNRLLAKAYFQNEDYEKMVNLVDSRLYSNKEFSRSELHHKYAIALEKLGYIEKAENELEAINDSYTPIKTRVHYAELLLRNNKRDKLEEVIYNILSDHDDLSFSERNAIRPYLSKAKQILKALEKKSSYTK